MTKGHQLPELRAVCNTNMDQVVAQTAVPSKVVVGSGMGLEKFRRVMNINIADINTTLTRTYPLLHSGHTVWDCRVILKAMFDNIGALET